MWQEKAPVNQVNPGKKNREEKVINQHIKKITVYNHKKINKTITTPTQNLENNMKHTSTNRNSHFKYTKNMQEFDMIGGRKTVQKI